MSEPRVATVSVDVDPVDLHLIGYGYSGLPPDPLVYRRALPRLLEIFARCGVRATLFVVGRDAPEQRDALAAAAAAGHEIASHSQTHPLAFASLAPEAMRAELEKSRTALEQASGRDVLGFRSPNFDMNERGLAALAECGYRYDASGYPTPLLFPARLLLAFKSRDPGSVLRLKPWPFTMRRFPYRWSRGERSLIEFPATVTPLARLPIYHTLRYALSDARFESALDGVAREGGSLSYALHAVDALGQAEDGVDGRLAKHPGMERALEGKLTLLERSLRSIVQRFASRTFGERVGEFAN
jgi:peptidoglycan/xylan/chitin deacetylase (PgdA/CDA1 family)